MELKRRYTVVFENADKDGWGSYVPDLPGCTSAGSSFDEVVMSVQISIEMWLQQALESGEQIPPPSTQALSLSVAV